MGVKSDYATSVRNEIDRYAVWEPGQPLALGDFGELHDRTFEKRGNIKDFGISFEERFSSKAFYEFTSAGTSIAEASLDGSVSIGMSVASPRASLEFKFAQERGLFLRAADSYTIQVDSLYNLAADLSRMPEWKFHWKVIAEIRIAPSAIILMGRAANSTVKIEASVDALEQFRLGKLKADAGLNMTGEVGYKVIGVRGPLLVDLIRVRRFWGNAIRQLDGVDAKEPYERVSTAVETEDDSEIVR
jgi:hypothetical protein